jgi:hypothetical protein
VTLRGRKLKITLTSKGRACMDDGLTLKQMILQKIATKEYSLKELAPIAGYSEKYANNFKRALNGDTEFSDFQGIINVIEYIWNDKVVDLMTKYSEEIDPNRATARCMLEFLSSNRQLDALKTLLDKMGKCNNKESKEWAKVYSLQHYAQSNYPNIDFAELVKKAKNHKTNIVELQVFLRLIKAVAYHQKGNFHMVKTLAEENELYVDDIENEYLKDMYSARLSENMSLITLRVLNRPEESRKYADKILKSQIGKAIKAFAYFQKGYSYLFSSYEDSLHYLRISMEMYKAMNREWIVKDLEEKIEFLKVYHDKLEKPECRYIINYLLMNIKNGIKVGKLIEEKKNEMDEPMYLYLKGCNDKDYVVLIEAALKYVKKGDSFLGTLAKNELDNLGYRNNHLIKELLEIRNN